MSRKRCKRIVRRLVAPTAVVDQLANLPYLTADDALAVLGEFGHIADELLRAVQVMPAVFVLQVNGEGPMLLNPEVSLQERMAVAALRGGWATTDHFNLLADCRDMLILAANEKNDRAAIAACDLAGIALMNMKDRHAKLGKIGATGDELQALDLLVDVSEDFWKRQGGGLFIDAEAALQRARQVSDLETAIKAVPSKG